MTPEPELHGPNYTDDGRIFYYTDVDGGGKVYFVEKELDLNDPPRVADWLSAGGWAYL